MNNYLGMDPNLGPISAFRSLRRLRPIFLILLLVAVSAGLAQPQAPAPPGLEQLSAAGLSPQSLPRVLADGAAALEGQIKSLESNLAKSQQRLALREADLKNLQVAAASLKAALAVENPPQIEIQGLLASYALLAVQAQERDQALAGEIKELSEKMTAETAAKNTLRTQIGVLQGAGEPTASGPEMQTALSRYLQLADHRDQLALQLSDTLERTRKVVEQQEQLLASLQPELKGLEMAWKEEILVRPPSEKRLQEQLAGLGASLAALPGLGWRWLSALVAAVSWQALFLSHLPGLLGLVIFLALLVWGSRGLRRYTVRRFRDWRAARPDWEQAPIFVLGQLLVDSLWYLASIFWVAAIFWEFKVLGSPAGRLFLHLLAALWALRLALDLVQAIFAGKAAAGVLPLDARTARFYRRSLKVLAVYLILGIFALTNASLLKFPESSALIAEHSFLVGLLAWPLWLLRREPFRRLQPTLPNPAWVRRPATARAIKGTILLLLAFIILADLLGLINLAVYAARAAVWTGMASHLVWFLWLAGEGVIHYLLHPEKGWAQLRYPRQQRILQRIYGFSRVLLSIILGAAVIFWALASWGIPPAQAAWAFEWLTWGPRLGPVKLTPLNISRAILVFYLGFWLSRWIRDLMSFRIFPHTALDRGVQYTITTTVHYVVLVLAALLALSSLGFPLTNLALVAGALGIGIGFGLQNLVNNFVSGLILLFERPIKVGDLLVIDGQWGTVKEIRVRSTIFETYDHSVLIIPNSELISQKVLNWTHYGRGINRLTLKVGVGCNSDVRQVTQLLTEICRANPRVVAEPPPQIYLAVYGESSLDFTIWVYLGNPADRVPATHELNSAIFETLQQHGIEMPFPQRDLHIKDWPVPPPETGS